jgi:hypothetical protein
LWAILGGRAGTALRTLTGEPWTLALVAILAVLALLRFVPPSPLRALYARRPAVRTLATAALTGSLVALVVEDTGSDIAAYLISLCLVAILVRLLQGEETGVAAAVERPASDVRGGIDAAPEGSGP